MLRFNKAGNLFTNGPYNGKILTDDAIVLTILEHIPDGFLETTPRSLFRVLQGPTLIHLPGRQEERLFVCILQHGNEEVGLSALQGLLRKYVNQALPRALSVFVGNVAAARAGVRHLDTQPDYNRVWPGGSAGDTPEHKIMQQVVDIMKTHKLFASIDLHNNIGINPHYACVNRLDHRFLQLANIFSRTVVYFTSPKGVQSLAFAELCPSTTLECGQAGSSRGVTHALEFLDACMHLAYIPNHPISARDMDLFHTVAVVKIPEAASLGVEDLDTDISLLEDLELLNFRELQPGTILASTKPGSDYSFEVWGEDGELKNDQYLRGQDNKILLTRPVMPSMLTIKEEAIRQDCLCYFMERYPLPALVMP